MLTAVPGVLVGHWTDLTGMTGCTAIVVPDGSVASAEVRGLAPATRELALLAPEASIAGPHVILLCGGSAFGLAAADGVLRSLAAAGRGVPTGGGVVPVVSAAAIFDLMLGAASAPGPEEGAAALAAAAPGPHAVGTVGAGTGATAGKLDGVEGWTKAGLGAAAATLPGGTTVAALAVANPFGDVLGEDGSVLAGLRREGAFVRTTAVLATEAFQPPPLVGRQATTLVVVATDAALDKVGCQRLARAGSTGIARATDPASTGLDGDVVFAFATRALQAPAEPAVAPIAASVVAAAIRDAALQATGVPGCPSAADLRA